MLAGAAARQQDFQALSEAVLGHIEEERRAAQQCTKAATFGRQTGFNPTPRRVFLILLASRLGDRIFDGGDAGNSRAKSALFQRLGYLPSENAL